MLLLIFQLLSLLILSEAAVPAPWPPKLLASRNATGCANPQPNTCTFYTACLEAHEQCGPDGYPIGFGEHYCEAFTDASSDMSDSGQQWVTDTMLCLQRALIPYGTGAQSMSCDDLKEYAFGTHPDCYVNSGVCILPPSDWKKIVDTVGLDELFGSWDSLKATLQTVEGCEKFYFWLIEQGILAVWDDIEDTAEDIWDWATGWL